jgi:hypothetical protein
MIPNTPAQRRSETTKAINKASPGAKRGPDKKLSPTRALVTGVVLGSATLLWLT